jgi:hypothetical protein
MNPDNHLLHLKNRELQRSPEVDRAVVRIQGHTGEKVPNDPAKRIEAYMDRLEKVFLNPDERVRRRNLEMLRDKIYDALIITRENFPESYFELQKRVAREQGHGDVEITPEMREQMMDVAIQDQRASLDAWIDYLTSNDAVYPAWFKYYVWTQITKLSQFDKERGEFKKRTASTVAPFPDIYREPLAQIADLYERVKDDNKDSEARREFDKKFPSLYAELIQKTLEQQAEGKEEIKGQWVKYEQGDTSGAEKLYRSLEGKGTGWCTAGRSTAETQIESGDFYVYYTYDSSGKLTQPRLAIRMNGKDKIGEVRGILPHQNVEPLLQGVLNDKLAEFGAEADAYRKKSADMKYLTELERKHEQGELFTKDDLIFLYEINGTIEGFGYQRDPRIEELRAQRNPNEDALIIFDCTREQIAHNEREITQDTKVYIGPLFPNIFQTHIEHIYTSFPEGKIQKYHIEIGGKTKEQLEQELKDKNIYVSIFAHELLTSPDFIASKIIEGTDLVRLSVEDLGFPQGATTDEIYERAQQYGLELCPAEVGPHLRLSYSGDDMMFIAMKQISDRGGYPNIFFLGRDGAGLWLDAYYALPGRGWNGSSQFVFSLRKLES